MYQGRRSDYDHPASTSRYSGRGAAGGDASGYRASYDVFDTLDSRAVSYWSSPGAQAEPSAASTQHADGDPASRSGPPRQAFASLPGQHQPTALPAGPEGWATLDPPGPAPTGHAHRPPPHGHRHGWALRLLSVVAVAVIALCVAAEVWRDAQTENRWRQASTPPSFEPQAPAIPPSFEPQAPAPAQAGAGCGAPQAGEAIALPDPGMVTSEITISGCGGSASARTSVTVAIQHQRRSDVSVELVSPTGAVYRFTPKRQVDPGANIRGSAVFDASGSPRDGTWTLRLIDDRAGVAGRLAGWTLLP